MPALIDKPAPGVLRYLAARPSGSITGVDDMRAVLEHAAEVFGIETSALHVSQKSGVVSIETVSADTSQPHRLRLVS